MNTDQKTLSTTQLHSLLQTLKKQHAKEYGLQSLGTQLVRWLYDKVDAQTI